MPIINNAIQKDPLEGTQVKPATAQVAKPLSAVEPVKPVEGVDVTPAGAAPEVAKAPAAVPEAAPAGITPARREIDPTRETVAGQMETLLGKESPYIRQARRETARQAGGRGLINTIMAQAAGEEAAIKAALPIAQQDAQTYFQQGIAEQAGEQKMRESRQAAELTMEVAEQRQIHDTYRMELQTQLDQMKESHSAGLKEHLELVLADKKLSNDMKGTFAQEMGRIMTESQTQIGTVGASDRTAAQQSSAITQIIKQRDSQIVLLKDMMQQSTQWDWFGKEAPAAA